MGNSIDIKLTFSEGSMRAEIGGRLLGGIHISKSKEEWAVIRTPIGKTSIHNSLKDAYMELMREVYCDIFNEEDVIQSESE